MCQDLLYMTHMTMDSWPLLLFQWIKLPYDPLARCIIVVLNFVNVLIHTCPWYPSGHDIHHVPKTHPWLPTKDNRSHILNKHFLWKNHNMYQYVHHVNPQSPIFKLEHIVQYLWYIYIYLKLNVNATIFFVFICITKHCVFIKISILMLSIWYTLQQENLQIKSCNTYVNLFLFCLKNKILKMKEWGLILSQRFGSSLQMQYFKMRVAFLHDPKPSTLTISPYLLL
jgi:hypothetical protein